MLCITSIRTTAAVNCIQSSRSSRLHHILELRTAPISTFTSEYIAGIQRQDSTQYELRRIKCGGVLLAWQGLPSPLLAVQPYRQPWGSC